MNEDQRNENQRFSVEEWNKGVLEIKGLKELIKALVLGQADLIREIRENTVKINAMPDERERQRAFHALYRASERRVMQFDEAVRQAQKIIEDIVKPQTELLEMLGKICKKVDSFDKIRQEIFNDVSALRSNLGAHSQTLDSHRRYLKGLEEREDSRWDTIFKAAIVFAILFLVVEILIRKFT